MTYTIQYGSIANSPQLQSPISNSIVISIRQGHFISSIRLTPNSTRFYLIRCGRRSFFLARSIFRADRLKAMRIASLACRVHYL